MATISSPTLKPASKAGVSRRTSATSSRSPSLRVRSPTHAASGSSADVHSRNVCVFADGEIDRSPTGTGVSARLAIHHARGDLRRGEEIVVESLVGSRFGGRVVEEAEVAGRPAVVPEVSGSAWITGRHEFFFAPDDPFGEGFLVR